MIAWLEEMEGAEKRLAALGASTFATGGAAFLASPLLPSRQGLFVAGGTLDEIASLASGSVPCSRWLPAQLREELLAAAQTCLERQGAAAVLIPAGRPGIHRYVAAGLLDQIASIAASQITNLSD